MNLSSLEQATVKSIKTAARLIKHLGVLRNLNIPSCLRSSSGVRPLLFNHEPAPAEKRNLIKEIDLDGHGQPTHIDDDFFPTDRIPYRIKAPAIHVNASEDVDEDKSGKQKEQSSHNG